MRFFSYNNNNTFIIENRGNSVEVSLQELLELTDLLIKERSKLLQGPSDYNPYKVNSYNDADYDPDNDWVWGSGIDDDDDPEEL